VISELVGVDGNMLRGNRVTEFAQRHSLPVVAVADLVRYRRRTESLVEPSGAADIPTPYGTFRAVAYRGVLNGIEHLALVCGDVSTAEANRRGVLVRVHSECITGDVISSLRCDCGSQLRNALQAIAQDGCGAVVYLRGHEGRGIGLGHKLRAYELQEQGFDTVDANTQLGLPIDSREYGVGAQILAELGIRRIRLLSNNPAKFGGIGGYGLSIVERVPLPSEITAQNVRYLRTKRDRMGHALADQLADVEATPCYLFT
jgi:3,4-dihydroxy 2-butanone 4-phosphate synthase/GTP cyclohydrolase II